MHYLLGFRAGGVGEGAQAAQQADLDGVERIDIRVALAHGTLQGRFVFQQFALAGDTQYPVAGLAEGAFDLVVHGVTDRFVGDETGVEAGDAHIGLNQGDLGVVDDDLEERPFLVHGLQQRQTIGAVGGQRLTDAVPTGQNVAALHPAKAPGDGPQPGKGVAAAGPFGGAGANAHLVDFADGGGLLPIVDQRRGFVDELTVGAVGHGR